jgi:hypothetical protein
MKTRGLLLVSLVMAVISVCSNALAASGAYSAQLISPRAGQVLYPGQKVRVEWNATLPDIPLSGCEMEVWLSLDGGRTFTLCLTPHMDPRAKYFYWTVPNTPSNAAVLDIRFGCDVHYPESYSPQPASTFVIATAAPAVSH